MPALTPSPYKCQPASCEETGCNQEDHEHTGHSSNPPQLRGGGYSLLCCPISANLPPLTQDHFDLASVMRNLTNMQHELSTLTTHKDDVTILQAQITDISLKDAMLMTVIIKSSSRRLSFTFTSDNALHISDGILRWYRSDLFTYISEAHGTVSCVVPLCGPSVRKQFFYSQYDSRYVGCHWLIKPATLIGRNASL